MVADRHTDRQTDTQTNAGKNILPRFRGENHETRACARLYRTTSDHCMIFVMCVGYVCLYYTDRVGQISIFSRIYVTALYFDVTLFLILPHGYNIPINLLTYLLH